MVAAFGNVKRGQDLWIHFLDPVDAGLQQGAEIWPVRRASGDRIVAHRRPAAVTAMDEHAGGRFVANLHHIGPSTTGNELGYRVLRVVMYGRRQLADGCVPLPLDRDALLAGIGPVVAVVKV